MTYLLIITVANSKPYPTKPIRNNFICFGCSLTSCPGQNSTVNAEMSICANLDCGAEITAPAVNDDTIHKTLR